MWVMGGSVYNRHTCTGVLAGSLCRRTAGRTVVCVEAGGFREALRVCVFVGGLKLFQWF
jgi:hypothetical protein